MIGRKTQRSEINLRFHVSYQEDGNAIHKDRNAGVEASFFVLLGRRK